MSEKSDYPYIPLAKFNDVDRIVLTWLVEKGRLPKDILVRASLQDDLYCESLNDAVLAALNATSLPDFVSEPLPNAFTFFVAANYNSRNNPHPLTMLEEDFHEFSTLHKLAKSQGINPNLMYTLWKRVITEIQPELVRAVEEENGLISSRSHSTNVAFSLSYAIVKDEPVFEMYQDLAVHQKLYRGIGRRSLLPLGYMLADNHPELFDQLDGLDNDTGE